MAFMKNQLYKVIAIDQPMYVEEVDQDPKSFRCLGYVKRKVGGAYETNYFADHNMRFSHDFWKTNMFNTPDKRNGEWWGRDSKTAETWANAAFAESFKSTEGPKFKYAPAYEKHFVPNLDLETADFAEFVYKRSVDYMKCLSKSEMEAA